jgi:antitoxin VapB
MLTQLFKNADGLAVRIPPELSFGEAVVDVEIERRGDALVIRPVRERSLAGLLDKFAAFPPDFMAEGREFQPENDRLDPG